MILRFLVLAGIVLIEYSYKMYKILYYVMQTEDFQNLLQWVKQLYKKEAAYNAANTKGQYSCISQTNTLRKLNWNELTTKFRHASTVAIVRFHDQSDRQI
jgi:hypothetical protein